MNNTNGIIDAIDCTVTSCSYNSSKKCTADHIKVAVKNAEDSEYADCVTYKPKMNS